MDAFTYKPIGEIHTFYKDGEGMPIQGGIYPDSIGRVEVFEEYVEGLLDLDGFSHIILLYAFHKSRGYNLKQKPFLDDMEHGVFAIRSPKRPNSIGLTVVEVDGISGNVIHVSGVDVLNGTPLLDIKPYVPEFDVKKEVRIGWLEGKIMENHLSDDRFK